MKHQQIQLASKRNVIRLAALVVMLAVMVCGMIISINAADNSEAQPVVTFADGSTIQFDEQTGRWVKTYDGEAEIELDAIESLTIDGEAVTATSATFNSKNAGITTITIIYGDNQTLTLPAEIKRAPLTWDGQGQVNVTYDFDKSLYSNELVGMSGVTLNGVIEGDEVSFDAPEVTFEVKDAADFVANVKVILGGADKDNYDVADLEVKITVAPIEIVDITWQGITGLTYGDDLSGIKALGNGTIPMTVIIDGTTVKAEAPNALYKVTATNATQTLTISDMHFDVVFNDVEFLDKGATLNTGFGYQLVVEGASGVTLPAEVLAAIEYEYTKGGVVVTGTITEPGVYTVKAKMPTEVEINGEKVKLSFNENETELTATMTVVRNYIIVSTPDGSIIIVSETRISNSVSATLTVPTEFAKKALRGVKEYKGYTITITGAEEGQVFSIYLPVSADLVANKNFEGMSVESLYLYNATEGTKATAKDSYTVTLSEDGFYYIIGGYAPAGETTFMLAPEYKVPFWTSAIGIALIVLIALILLVVLPIFIGMKLVQLENSGRNPVIAVETDGNVPEIQPVIIPDLIEDPDALLEEGVEALADFLADEVVPEEAEFDVDATDAVADAMDVLNAEVAEIDLGNADGALNDMVDQMALDLAEQIAAEGTEDDVSDEVKQAVADAMAENFNESADATDAIALVEDEEVIEEVVEAPVEEVVEEVEETPVEAPVVEETVVEEVVVEEAVVEEPVVAEVAPAAEESEEDDDESFGGFGSMPLDYIDAIAQAERYAEMLEQERRGEVQLVTRYRRSYLSRLAQSQGSIQDYYNAIKNLLLSYKGVKSRISWGFESFNVGRTPLAKFNAKTRTLYVYIAFSPEELADTKYNFTDMSAKKKYAAVPVLIKVKGDRKFKHALELITKLCEEKLQLPKKKNFTETDYRMPFKTTEELVQEGIVKMMVAAIPVAAPTAEETVVEEAAAEEAVAEEAVAEEAVAEEATVEEAVAEEAVAEEAVAEEAIVEEAVAEEAVAEEVVAEEVVAEETNEEA